MIKRIVGVLTNYCNFEILVQTESQGCLTLHKSRIQIKEVKRQLHSVHLKNLNMF